MTQATRTNETILETILWELRSNPTLRTQLAEILTDQIVDGILEYTDVTDLIRCVADEAADEAIAAHEEKKHGDDDDTN